MEVKSWHILVVLMFGSVLCTSPRNQSEAVDHGDEETTQARKTAKFQ